jgi:predicted SAM-dependent methyltransferase
VQSSIVIRKSKKSKIENRAIETRVNLGCGSHYHPDWINIDIAPLGPGVIAHDLSRGIPLADNSSDVVYHSHVLEHIRRADVAGFLRECYRVLKPGGTLRVVVPDLERICRAYIEKLEGALAGDAAAANDYDWIMLEMYDQTVRERSGGMMGAYLRRDPIPNEAFIYERIGEEGRKMIDGVRRRGNGKPATDAVTVRHSIIGRLREKMAALLLGGDGKRVIGIGRFRLEGEVHQWMYDRYSLARLLREIGFVDPVQQSATSSRIPDWPSYNLDTLADGTVVKPDSLFMEAGKGVKS